MRLIPVILITLLGSGGNGPALSAPCGGDFGTSITAIKPKAAGLIPAQTDQFFAALAPDPEGLQADHNHDVFREPFTEFARAQTDYGILLGILPAFWAAETDYGSHQGDFDTANALATLAHDCRRPELFQPQLLAAATLWPKREFYLATAKGAWSGEIAMVQMLPADILACGIDGIRGTDTRDAGRREQIRLGLPADGWPTLNLLEAI
jgi:membrane-bound lytic murein transglycosylase B